MIVQQPRAPLGVLSRGRGGDFLGVPIRRKRHFGVNRNVFISRQAKGHIGCALALAVDLFLFDVVEFVLQPRALGNPAQLHFAPPPAGLPTAKSGLQRLGRLAKRLIVSDHLAQLLG